MVSFLNPFPERIDKRNESQDEIEENTFSLSSLFWEKWIWIRN